MLCTWTDACMHANMRVHIKSFWFKSFWLKSFWFKSFWLSNFAMKRECDGFCPSSKRSREANVTADDCAASKLHIWSRRASQNRAKLVPKMDPKCSQHRPTWCPRGVPEAKS